MKQILKFALAACLGMMVLPANAEEGSPVQTVTQQAKPITQAEIQQALAGMQQRLNTRIENWGKALQPEDFEWTWRGRKLKQGKQQEVCNIFQDVVNEMYQLAVENQARLSPQDQNVLSNRNLFIEKLGYAHNRVNTQMGFDCRLQ